MTIMLKVYLMGLIALVPTRDGGLTVLLQRTLEGEMKHTPVLVWDSKVDAALTRDGAPVAEHQGKEIRKRFLLTDKHPSGLILDGETITIQGTRPGKVSSPKSPVRPWYAPFFGAVPHTPPELASPAWIPDMKKISQAAGSVKAELLEHPNSEDLAGILKLAGSATLSTFHVAGWKDDYRSFTFRPSFDAHVLLGNRGAIADVVLLTVPVEVSEGRPAVTVVLRRFDGPGERRIVLTPRPGVQSVDLLVGNLTPTIDDTELVPTADHFALYYKLTEKGGNVPVKIPVLGMSVGPKAKVKADLPEVLSSVSGPCNSARVPDEKIFRSQKGKGTPHSHQGSSGAGAGGDKPPTGGICRPICGVVTLPGPVKPH